jgi:hypothetical protein
VVDWGAFGSIRSAMGCGPLGFVGGAVVFPRCGPFTLTRRSKVSPRACRGLRRLQAPRGPWSTTTSAAPSQTAGLRHSLPSATLSWSLRPAALRPARETRRGKIERQIQHLRHAFFARLCRCRRPERPAGAGATRLHSADSTPPGSDRRAGPAQEQPRPCRSPRIPSRPT